MRFFTFVIALTAFIIAGCAAYFSVSGLATLFAGAFWAIVVMGAILEIGKLVATSFLYRYWNVTSVLLKTYLMFSVFVLMIITSIGIFGYLSRAHIEQQGNIKDAVVLVEKLESRILKEQEKVDTLNQRIKFIESETVDISPMIQRQESIRDSAWSMVQRDIDFEQSQIDDIQSNLQSQLESLDRKYQLDLQDLNTEQDRIETELQTISVEERRMFSKKQNDLKNSLREQQSRILFRKEDIRNKLDSDKEKLRTESYQRISLHQEKINEHRQRAQKTIDDANQRINDLKIEEDNGIKTKIEKSGDLQVQMDELYSTIESLKIEKFDAESKVRLVETEVGPIKYVAEALYGDTESNTVEKAVRLLILLIVFVFDPLAVALVLAYNSLIVAGRREIETELSKNELFEKLKKVKTRNGEIRDLNGNKKMETEIK
jgi:hypothetical protein